MWPLQLSNNDVQYLVQNKPNCRKQLSYFKDNNERSFSNTYFTRIFKNGNMQQKLAVGLVFKTEFFAFVINYLQVVTIL